MLFLNKLFYSLVRPRYWRSLVLGVAPSTEHRHHFDDRYFNTILDVGANKGQFYLLARALWPKSRIICFEPMGRAVRVLKKVTEGNADIFPVALSAEDKKCMMHIATRDDSSSLLPLAQAQKTLFNMDESRVEKVDVHRMDSLLRKSDINHPALLKIDVQGGEFDVLVGSKKLLSSIDSVYVECSYMELYVGQKLAPELDAFLRAEGFRESKRCNCCYDKCGNLIQADLLYEREK